MNERLLAVLADGERRALIRTLVAYERRDQPLASAVAREVSDGLSSARLHHIHLPKLADADVIVWNRERGEIATGPRFDDARRLLERLRGRGGERVADT